MFASKNDSVVTVGKLNGHVSWVIKWFKLEPVLWKFQKEKYYFGRGQDLFCKLFPVRKLQAHM